MDKSKVAARPAGPDEWSADDQKLVAQLLERNRKAAGDFVSLYTDPVHAYIHNRLIPRTDLVDDMVQDVFLAAWRDLARFEGRSSLRSWLLGIARHKVEDYYRRRLRMPDALDIDETRVPEDRREPAVDQMIDRKRARERARKILQDLPETYALLLLWRYWEKKSAREMAAEIGRTEKAVERALARAREQFRRKWEDGERDAR